MSAPADDNNILLRAKRAFWRTLEAHSRDGDEVACLWTKAIVEAFVAMLHDLSPDQAAALLEDFNEAVEGSGFQMVYRSEAVH